MMSTLVLTMQMTISQQPGGYYGGGASSSMHGHPHVQAQSDTGFTTPHDMSGLLTPDLDLPFDFGPLDDLGPAEPLPGFPGPSHPPSAPTPHTHHYTQQQPHLPSQLGAHHPPPLHSSQG